MSEENFNIETEETDILSVEKKEKKVRHFNMKWTLITVGAVVAILIIGIIVYISVFGKDSEDPDSSQQSGNEQNTEIEQVEVIYDYEMTEISKIEIQNNLKNDSLVITPFMNGTVQNWNVEGQLYDDVNQLAVRYIAQFASHLESKYVFESDGTNLREYGLEEPNSKVKITYTDGNVITVNVGNIYGSSEGTYVSVEGKNKVYVVSNYAHIYFTYGRTDILNLPTLSKTTASAQTISVFDEKRNQVTLSYLMNPLYETDAWFIITPTNAETDSASVDEYFGKLSEMSLTAYYCETAGEDLSKYGFDKPTFELQSYSASQELLDHLIVGKVCEDDPNNYYCMLIGKDEKFETSPVYLISKENYEKCHINPVNLANPFLLSLNIDWLRSGRIIIDGTTYEITIERQLKYDDEGKVIYNDDGTESTLKTYYINGQKLDETQFKYFYRMFMFLRIEGMTNVDAVRNGEAMKYELEVVIPVLDSETNEYKHVEKEYVGTYHVINDTFAVYESNQSENAVFTVRRTSLDRVKEALQLLLEGRMPTE